MSIESGILYCELARTDSWYNMLETLEIYRSKNIGGKNIGHKKLPVEHVQLIPSEVACFRDEVVWL